MAVTVQVRDLDEQVQERLRMAAVREGMSLSALLRRELTRVAARLDSEAIDGARRNRLGISVGFFDDLSMEEIVANLREDRDR
jgi:plasmid stability protein